MSTLLLDSDTAPDLGVWRKAQREAKRRQQEIDEHNLFLNYGPACTHCDMIILRKEQQPVRCVQRRCKALLHLQCLNDHDLNCDEATAAAASAASGSTESASKQRKLGHELPSTDGHHPESWDHVSPPPPLWTHNDCGPASIQEVGGMLLRCVPGLRPLLLPDTLVTLDTLAEQRSQPAAITEQTPWRVTDKCDCARCLSDGATAQDHFLQKALYYQMNRHRTLDDQQYEGLRSYKVGGFTDVRRMFESYLGTRTMSHPHHALPGLGLCVVYRCYLCQHETRPPGMLRVETAASGARPLPGMPKTCTTQQVLNQLIGNDSILDHLPDTEAEHLNTVKNWGSTCYNNNCISLNYADTVLPWKLNNQEPLPPLLRVTKGVYSSRFSSIGDMITLTDHDGSRVVYKLLAVIYGNTQHFTADIRYHIDQGNEQYFHYDPFHFPADKLLALSDDLPACMGGTPTFQHRHTEAMRESFQKHTNLRNVTTAVYGIVAVSQERVMDDELAEPSLPPTSATSCKQSSSQT